APCARSRCRSPRAVPTLRWRATRCAPAWERHPCRRISPRSPCGSWQPLARWGSGASRDQLRRDRSTSPCSDSTKRVLLLCAHECADLVLLAQVRPLLLHELHELADRLGEQRDVLLVAMHADDALRDIRDRVVRHEVAPLPTENPERALYLRAVVLGLLGSKQVRHVRGELRTLDFDDPVLVDQPIGRATDQLAIVEIGKANLTDRDAVGECVPLARLGLMERAVLHCGRDVLLLIDARKPGAE